MQINPVFDGSCKGLALCCLAILLVSLSPLASFAQEPSRLPVPQGSIERSLVPSPAVREQLRRFIAPNSRERWRDAMTAQRLIRATLGAERCTPGPREVTIDGQGFGTARNGRDIFILRRKLLGVLSIVSWSDTRIVGRIPESVPDRDSFDLIMAAATDKNEPKSRVSLPRASSGLGASEDPLEALNPISNLISATGCVRYTSVGGGARLDATLNPLGANFPRKDCRAVDLDTLDILHETIVLPRSGPGDRSTDRDRRRTIFRIVDRNGTVVSFQGPSYDMVGGVFFYILENWLQNVCYGPTLGNYDSHPGFRLMYWTDMRGQLPLRSTFDGRDDAACPACLDTGTAFKQCRVIPDLSRTDFVEVPPNSRDTRTTRERRPESPVPVWGIRTNFTVGPREFYSVSPWPLFRSEADVALGKRLFAGRDTTVCSFGAFNVHYGLSGPIGYGSEEHDGMQFFVRQR